MSGCDHPDHIVYGPGIGRKHEIKELTRALLDQRNVGAEVNAEVLQHIRDEIAAKEKVMRECGGKTDGCSQAVMGIAAPILYRYCLLLIGFYDKEHADLASTRATVEGLRAALEQLHSCVLTVGPGESYTPSSVHYQRTVAVLQKESK